jgi:hypothetical protein
MRGQRSFLTVDPRSLIVDLRVIDGEYALIIGDGVQAMSIEKGATGSDWRERVDGLIGLREEVHRYIDMIEGEASRAGQDRVEHLAPVLQLQGRTWSSD